MLPRTGQQGGQQGGQYYQSDSQQPSLKSAASSHLLNDVYMAQFGSLTSSGSERSADTVRTCTGVTYKYPKNQPFAEMQGGAGKWATGPSEMKGRLVNLSEHNLLRCCADWDVGEVYVAAADHAVYVLDASKARRKRELHRTGGHTEWVTSVAMGPRGTLLSGGQDGRLCTWQNAGPKCHVAKEHTGPVSGISYSPGWDVVVTTGYDKKAILWQTSSSDSYPVATMPSHPAPIMVHSMEGDVHPIAAQYLRDTRTTGVMDHPQQPPPPRLATGDRSGNLAVWELEMGKALWKAKPGHMGHVTALEWTPRRQGSHAWGGCLLSGGQDGCLHVWDARQVAPVCRAELHRTHGGRGAVSDITVLAAGGPHIATTGADCTAQLLDMRLLGPTCHSFASLRLPDFPYSQTAIDSLLLVGCGDGTVHVIDSVSGRTLYSIRAAAAAVRDMVASPKKLVCISDDGSTSIHDF